MTAQGISNDMEIIFYITGPLWGESPVDSPHKGPVMFLDEGKIDARCRLRVQRIINILGFVITVLCTISLCGG